MAKTAIDITGQRFGRLVALRPTDRRHNGSIVWECQCDCGKTAFVKGYSLKKGYTKSCGCLHEVKAVDLTGQRFGRLTAIRPTEQRGKGGFVIWECKCDCGNTKLASTNSLRGGNTKSCGCLRKKKV